MLKKPILRNVHGDNVNAVEDRELLFVVAKAHWQATGSYGVATMARSVSAAHRFLWPREPHDVETEAVTLVRMAKELADTF